MDKTYSVDEFDFVNLVIYDVHGIPRGICATKERMPGVVKSGMGIYGGVCYFGICDQPNVHKDCGKHNNYGNMYLKPVLDTLKPWSKKVNGKHRVGQVMCTLERLDGTLETSTPRTAAVIQLEKLKSELGLTIKSAFEMEFTIRHSTTKEYLGHVSKWATVSVVDYCQEILMDMVQELKDRGINVDTLQTELGPGQFEFTLDVAEGIKGADSTADFKNAVKTFMRSRGYDASFMTRVDPALGCCNGYHYNHSLWTSDGKNAFLDASSPTKLSQLGSHWLAGLIEHAPAMLAFSNPTINCYRRVGAPWAPNYADWGNNNRMATYRLKAEQGNNVYLENRLPTSACNPYLVMACTIAAGMDGVRRKLPLPKPLSHDVSLPRDLDGALKALEADTVLTKALGEKVVEYFIHSKRNFEIEEFDKFSGLTEEQRLEKEREFYFLNA